VAQAADPAAAPGLPIVRRREFLWQGPADATGTHSVALAPLSDSDTTVLLRELLGLDPSVDGVTALISERAAGNPFFAEETVRELADRGVLHDDRGRFACRMDIAQVSVPATLYATIAARIDRLDPTAKRTLNAAAVIGSRFSPDLLPSLGIEPVLDELIKVEVIDQVKSTPRAEYAFRHPLIRDVAYESQLKSDRAVLHRRLAAAIEARDPGSADENGRLIADHLEAAGDLRAAYGWHLRAGKWSTNRDIAAAYLSWERACRAADALPADDLDRAAIRIAPRVLLCDSAWRVHASISARFEELGQLCTRRGQGLVGDRHGRAGERPYDACPRARGVAAGIRVNGLGGVDRRFDSDGRGGHRRDLHQTENRRDGRRAALVTDSHRPSPGRTHQRQSQHGIAVGGGAGIPRICPMQPRPARVAEGLQRRRSHRSRGLPDGPCSHRQREIRPGNTVRSAPPA
jgi:hypothetical protein